MIQQYWYYHVILFHCRKMSKYASTLGIFIGVWDKKVCGVELVLFTGITTFHMHLNYAWSCRLYLRRSVVRALQQHQKGLGSIPA